MPAASLKNLIISNNRASGCRWANLAIIFITSGHQYSVRMVKKIFITGASGFIGRAVVKRLKDNYELTLLLPEGESAVGLSGQNIVRGDVTRHRSLSGLIRDHDTVIHMAGSVGYQSWRNCMSINVDGSRNVIRQAVRAGVIRFIHMSSVSVYGRIPDIKITEEQAL